MDFLVGGLPRAGTTITADLFNIHPNVFCLAQESQILPILSFIADDAPVTENNIDYTRNFIEHQLSRILLIAPRHFAHMRDQQHILSLKSDFKSKPEIKYVFDESKLNALVNNITSLIQDGLYGKDLFTEALRILKKQIAVSINADLIGEKTPFNLFSISRFGLLGSRSAIIMKRDPFSFIKSMRMVRTGNEGLDKGFRKTLWEMIGIYRLCADAILELQTNNKIHIADYYNDFMKYPSGHVENIFKMINVNMNEEILTAACSRVLPKKYDNISDYFTPCEQEIIWNMTLSAREILNHNENYFNDLDITFTKDISDYQTQFNELHPISGFSLTGDSKNLWVSDRATFALETLLGCKTAVLDFWADYPNSILEENKDVRLQIIDSENSKHKIVGECTLNQNVKRSSIVINLENIPPIIEGRAGAVRVLSFYSTHSYRPISLPTSDGFGQGALRVSAMMLPITFY